MALNLTAQDKELGKANFTSASSSLSRRGFMKSVAAGAAVVPVGAAVYFGYESKIEKPVKAALIGCGDEGGVLLGEHNPAYIEFIAACDIRPTNRERILHGDPKVALRKGFKGVYGKEYADKIDKDHFYIDYREMFAKEPDIEAVVIALPLHLHAPVAIECMEKGKHVLCEKLMARNIPDCRKMIETAKKTNRILAIGHQRHYSMLYSQSLELVQSGVLGDLKSIHALWHRNFSWLWHPEAGMDLAVSDTINQPYYRDGWTPPIMHSDFMALQDKVKGDMKDHQYGYKDLDELIRWRLYERTGGGLMAELGSHQLDACSIFLGKVHPLAVQGIGTHSFFGRPGDKLFRNNREIDDHIFVTFEFPGKNHPLGPNKGTDEHDVVVMSYSSVSTNGFEAYGECLMGSRGTLIVEGEQVAMLFKENEPGKGGSTPRSTALSVSSAGAGAPALAAGATWGGPPPAAAAAGGAGGGGVPVSRGYREEMEDFACCIRRWDTSIGYQTEKKDGKEQYIQRLPRCHGEVALADAVLALSANEAMKHKTRIEFAPDHFKADSTKVPEFNKSEDSAANGAPWEEADHLGSQHRFNSCMMHDLTITPQGHLLVRETTLESTDWKLSKALLDAYRESSSHGMLLSASEGLDAALPPSFEFARSIARLYLASLCKTATGQPGETIPEIAPPLADLERAMLQAPPMIGLEYLSLESLSSWWQGLDHLTRREIGKHPGGAQGYLRERNPHWRFVGRVTLHLAENKRDPARPFAFLATFANGLTPQGKVKHEPLGRALQQYAGAGNREAMLTLLLPLSKAAESSELIQHLVESGEIYQPLAWSAKEAYSLLQAIPLLESSGLIVRVPDWWNVQKPARPRISVKIESKNSARIGIDAMLEFSVNVSLEGDTLSPEEIASLLESGGGLIALKGKWVEVDQEKLKDALAHWKRVEKDVRRNGISFHEGMRLLSGANLATAEEDDHAAAIREWSGLTAGAELDAVLQTLRSPETRQEDAPPGLKTELRPYQRTGYAWLRFVARLGLGACLADDMGLGKTIQVISLLLDLKRDPNKIASLLVVPASLIANWKSELARFAPGISFGVAHPSEANGKTAELGLAAVGSFDLIVTTYGMLVRTAWLKEYRWRLAILDEAQAIKNSGTKQSHAVKTLFAESRVALTGTPIENRLSDLWSLFDFLNPGLLGTAKQFGAFVKRLQEAETPSFEPLRSLVRPYILRRLKTDKRVISDLPDKTEVNAYCPLSKHQAALYQHAVDEFAKQLDAADGIQRRGIVLAQLMRLKQICNHPAQVAGTHDYAAEQSGKFRRLAEIVEEISSRQEKALVFTQFREITEPLAGYLATLFGRGGLVLHGGTSIKKRREIVDRFQQDDGPPFLVLSLKAGGTGLNLTAASHVIHFDRWWNPAVENQATDRAFRIGQKKNVLVHKFICRGTVEERIDEMIARKSQVAGEVIGQEGSGELLVTEMDNDTLLQFVKLDLHQATAG